MTQQILQDTGAFDAKVVDANATIMASEQMRLQELLQSYGHLEAKELLEPLIKGAFKDGIAVSSSFGAESAIILHMVAQVDPSTPILFIDTHKLFPETLAYRDTLIEHLGLTNVRIISPSEQEEQENDPNGDLWKTNPDACCDFRKVKPFDAALEEYSAIITGRKRYQANSRTELNVIEHDDERFKINPVAKWDIEKIQNYMKEHDLPAHPLVEKGYLSIGCQSCTSPVKAGEDPRSGRWRGSNKTECGIHFINGKLVRTTQSAA